MPVRKLVRPSADRGACHRMACTAARRRAACAGAGGRADRDAIISVVGRFLAWRRPRARLRRRARCVHRADAVAARDGRHRCQPALVGRQDARREPGGPARSRRRFAQGHGPAAATAGRGRCSRRETACRARQSRGNERAGRPAVRHAWRVRCIYRFRVSRDPCCRTRCLGPGQRHRLSSRIRDQVSARLFWPPRRARPERHLRQVAAEPACCRCRQRHPVPPRWAVCRAGGDGRGNPQPALPHRHDGLPGRAGAAAGCGARAGYRCLQRTTAACCTASCSDRRRLTCSACRSARHSTHRGASRASGTTRRLGGVGGALPHG
jgi:hypothetical protein